MRNSDASINESPRNSLGRAHAHAWALMIVGLMIGLAAMHLTAVRPLKQQIEGLDRELIALRGSVQQFAGLLPRNPQTADAQELARAHTAEIALAKRHLQAMRSLRLELQSESRKAQQAFIALDDLTALQGMLISQRRRIASAARAVDDVRRLHERVADLKQAVQQDAHDVDTAARRVEALLSLKDQIIWRGAGTAHARGNVERLLMLRDGLSAESIDVAAAGRNLERLLQMQVKLASRNAAGRAASAVEIDSGSAPRLRLDAAWPAMRRLGVVALEQSTFGRANRQFRPLLNRAGLRSIEEISIGEAVRRLAQRPDRLTRRNDPNHDAPGLDFPQPQRLKLIGPLDAPPWDAPVPWPVD